MGAEVGKYVGAWVKNVGGVCRLDVSQERKYRAKVVGEGERNKININVCIIRYII